MTHAVIDPAQLIEAVRSPRCGAVVTFLGTVRDFGDHQPTESLDYEAYPEMAERMMARIEADARRRWPIHQVVVVHRLGHLELGEVSVGVAVSSAHRAEAFDACRFIIDEVKRLVPIWKKENRPGGAGHWVHPGFDGSPRPAVGPSPAESPARPGG